MSHPLPFADRLQHAAAEATREELVGAAGWWPFRKRQTWRPDLAEREWAKRVAIAAVQRKLAETGSYPSERWLVEHVRTQMRVKGESKTAAWLLVFVARFLMLLVMFADEPPTTPRTDGPLAPNG